MKSLPFSLLETLYNAAGDNSLNLMRTILFADQNNYNLKYSVGNLANMKGFAEFVSKYPKIIEEALNQIKAEQKIHVSNLLNEKFPLNRIWKLLLN